MTTFIRVTVNTIRAGIEINPGGDPDGVVKKQAKQERDRELGGTVNLAQMLQEVMTLAI